MGLLGRGFALNLLDKGEAVRVWNRTASKAVPVGEAGATVAATPAEAVEGADRVHLVLQADDAVDEVVAALRPALTGGAFIIDHSTNLPARVAERFARLRAEGVSYLHAPVFMGPQNSREATGLMLLSAPTDEEATLRPLLEPMTGRVIYLGDEADKAAKIKLAGNGLLVMLTAAMGDLFTLGDACGVSHDEILALFDQFKPSAAAMGRRAVGAADRDPPGFTMTMARKDVGLMLETAGDSDALTVLPAVAAALDRGIAGGLSERDFAAFADPTREQ